MKNSIQEFKEMLKEEIEQLHDMKKYSQHTRNMLFGVILHDDEIYEKIENRKHRINECNQLLQAVEFGNLSIEDMAEIQERFEYVRKNIKHCLRCDKDETQIIFLDINETVCVDVDDTIDFKILNK